MAWRRLTLQWQLALACALPVVLLVAAVMVLTHLMLVTHLEKLAEEQADNTAQTLSGLFARSLERRATELRLMSHAAALSDLTRPAQVRSGLTALAAAAPAHRAIAVVDANGVALATVGAGLLPWTASAWPVLMPTGTSVWLDDARAVLPANGTVPSFVIDMGAPLHAEDGQPRGALVSQLDSQWLRRLRDEILAHSGGNNVLSVALLTGDNRPLIDDAPVLNKLALAAWIRRAPGQHLGRTAFGGEAGRVLVAHTELRLIKGLSVPAWQVLVTYDLDAALRPSLRLQWLVMVAGVLLAALFSSLVLLSARRVVAPYAGLLQAVTARFHAEEPAHAAGLTRYLDAVSAQVKRLPASARAQRRSDAAPVRAARPPLDVAQVMGLLAEDGKRMQRLLDALPVGVIVYDEQMRIVYWNQCCERISGWQAEEVLGRLPTDTFAADLSQADRAAMMARIQRRLDAFESTHRLVRRDGSVRTCLVLTLPQRNAEGELVRVLSVVQDATDAAMAEASKAQHAQEISALAHRLISHEEQFTRRLAHSLHDRLGQTLSALRLAFDAATPGARVALAGNPMDALIDKAVADVREALVELHPPLLGEQGLRVALDNEIHSVWVRPGGARISLSAPHHVCEPRYPAAVEYAAFMVAREAIANALRHATAKRIDVRLSGDGASLQLEVVDDGIGFEPGHQVARPGHLGLVGMRERALAVGAGLSVCSLPDGGCRVAFTWEMS
jgi:PAS domain S-box-containing protein